MALATARAVRAQLIIVPARASHNPLAPDYCRAVQDVFRRQRWRSGDRDQGLLIFARVIPLQLV